MELPKANTALYDQHIQSREWVTANVRKLSTQPGRVAWVPPRRVLTARWLELCSAATGTACRSDHGAITTARQATLAWAPVPPTLHSVPCSVESCALGRGLPRGTGRSRTSSTQPSWSRLQAPREYLGIWLRVAQSSCWLGCWASSREQVQGEEGTCSARRGNLTPEKLRRRSSFLRGFSHGSDISGRPVLHKIY